MLNAPTNHPHTTAFAVASGACVRGSLKRHGLRGMALSRAPYPIDRGVSR
jgi:hypothetical protein